MGKISKFRTTINAVLSTLLITLGMASKEAIHEFLLKHTLTISTNSLYFLIAIAGTLLAKIGGDPIVDWLIRIKKIRKWIIGKSFVEGYWLYQHYAGSAKKKVKSESIFYGNSLAELQFDAETGKLKMNVYRLEPDVGLFNSSSNMIYFDEKDFTYLSYFTYNGKDAKELVGFARGRYTGEPENGLHSYDGLIMIYDNTGKPMSIRQKGSKIDQSVIESLKKKFPNDNLSWRENYLKTTPEPI